MYPALPFDFTFPEVFFPQGSMVLRRGFDIVLGNPPWEGIDTSRKEFHARFDVGIFDQVDQEAEKELTRQLDAREVVHIAREDYKALIAGYKNAARVYLSYVNQGAVGASAATPDMFQCFAERGFQLLSDSGMVGIILPPAFHANESATGIRRLYLDKMALGYCYSFENRRKLFEIDSRFKFAIVVSSRPGPTEAFSCAFYLHDDDWLFQGDKGDRFLRYTPDFLQQTTGELRNFLELRSTLAVPIVDAMYGSKERTFGALRWDWGILPSEELHTSNSELRPSLSHLLLKLNPNITGLRVRRFRWKHSAGMQREKNYTTPRSVTDVDPAAHHP